MLRRHFSMSCSGQWWNDVPDNCLHVLCLNTRPFSTVKKSNLEKISLCDTTILHVINNFGKSQTHHQQLGSVRDSTVISDEGLALLITSSPVTKTLQVGN